MKPLVRRSLPVLLLQIDVDEQDNADRAGEKNFRCCEPVLIHCLQLRLRDLIEQTGERRPHHIDERRRPDAKQQDGDRQDDQNHTLA